MLYQLNTSGTAFVDSTVVATITGDGAFNYILPINVSASYVIGWKTSKEARFKLTSYLATITVSGTFNFTLPLQSGNFNNPDIVTPSYDGWTINPKTEFLAYSDISTNCLSISRGLRKDFITETNANYKFSGDVKYLGSSVFIPPIFGMSDNEEDNVPQISNRLDSLKITDISSLPVRITGVQFSGTSPIEKNFQATSNSTQIEFIISSIAQIGYAYYADNLKLEKIGGGSTIYTSNFTNQEIVSFDLDGWETNWETSYLSATTDTPSRFRVAGETPQTNRLFNVTPGLEYELSYTQSENASVNLFIEESDNGTTWQNIVSSSSSNGSQTVNFTPSASLLKVSFEASAGFKLQDVSLNGELYDTLITMESLGGTGYRYGYNTQERVDEVSGKGNHYTAEFWEYSPRLGRRWNRDPITYPWQSPYATNNNNPIYFLDPSGLEGEDPGEPEKEKVQEYDEIKVYGKRRALEEKSPPITLEKPSLFRRIMNKIKNFISKVDDFLSRRKRSYSPYEDRNKNPYETKDGIHGVGEGQGAENHRSLRTPETINYDMLFGLLKGVYRGSRVTQTWLDKAKKVDTSVDLFNKAEETVSDKMGGGTKATETRNEKVIIQDPGGSYMYDKSLGKWFQRKSCYSCPEGIDESGNVYKDSTYRNLPESSVPQHIRNQLK